MNITVIGMGRFGKFWHNLLSCLNPDNLWGWDTLEGISVSKLKIEALNSSDFIFICVPIRNFKDTCEWLANIGISENPVIVDVCSVKEFPITVMERFFPHNKIIGTHPLFGENSFKTNRTMLLVNPERTTEHFVKFKYMLEELDIHPVEISAIEHDKLMAKTQTTAFILGNVLTDTFKNTDELLLTPSSKLLNELVESIGRDSKELFEDIITFNKFSESVLAELTYKITGIRLNYF